MWRIDGEKAFVVRIILPRPGLDTATALCRAYPGARPCGEHPSEREGTSEIRLLMAAAARRMIAYLNGEAVMLNIPFAVSGLVHDGAGWVPPSSDPRCNGLAFSRSDAMPERNGTGCGTKTAVLPGTFTLGVLEHAYRIPRGKVITYGALAWAAGVPGAARAVGNVMAGNPLPLIIPCHRVVRNGGYLGGYGGGTELKRRLLLGEGVRFAANGRIIS